MSSHVTTLSWEHVRDSLWLCVGDHEVAVPNLITALLLGDAGHGLTDDPAIDLLRLELDLRRYHRSLGDTAATAREEVGYGRDAVTLAGADVGLDAHRHRRLALTHLATALQWYATCASQRRCVRSWITRVRWFVIGAAVPDGLLTEAAAGWRRASVQPSFIVVYPTAKDFVAENQARADTVWRDRHGSTPGTSFGEFWRRDGDDDDPQAAPLPRTGPWRLTYLPATGEIIAHRRAGRQPEKIWLLSSHWDDVGAATAVLSGLRPRMREPNSLILVAHTLHAERSTAYEPFPYPDAV
jgi:hypothetical protein